MKRWSLFLTLGVLLGVALCAVPSALAQNGVYPKVYDPDSVVLGQTYAEWSVAWVQWAHSIPVAGHPLFDNGDCSVGQSGPVWFLGGKFGLTIPNPTIRSARKVRSMTLTKIDRWCTIPIGKAIFYTIGNLADTAPEEPNWGCGGMFPPLATGTIAEMQKCVETFFSPGNPLETDVDGKMIANLQNYLVTSPAFGITWPDENLLTAIGEGPFPAGSYFPAVGKGYYIMLRPLTAGKHTLHFRQGDLSMTYHLTIQ